MFPSCSVAGRKQIEGVQSVTFSPFQPKHLISNVEWKRETVKKSCFLFGEKRGFSAVAVFLSKPEKTLCVCLIWALFPEMRNVIQAPGKNLSFHLALSASSCRVQGCSFMLGNMGDGVMKP